MVPRNTDFTKILRLKPGKVETKNIYHIFVHLVSLSSSHSSTQRPAHFALYLWGKLMETRGPIE